MSPDPSDRRLSRRDLLRGAGAIGGVALLAGCNRDGASAATSTPRRPSPNQEAFTATSSATPEPIPPAVRPYADGFGSVVDVARAGADASGRRSVNDVVLGHLDDDSLLYFPPGRYLMDGILELGSFSNLGLVGPDAVIVPPDGYSDYLFALGHDDGSSGLFVEGLTFDFRAENTGARPIQALVEDDLVVRNVSVRGQQDTDQDMMRFDVTSPEGTGLVQGLSLPDGGAVETPTTGCYVGSSNRGTLSFVDCHIANFPDNGLYASSSTGPIYVVGGRYENNGIANVRVSGESVVRGVHVRCDAPRPGLDNMRGIRIRSGSGTLVEDCVVELIDVTGSDGAIAISGMVDGATIRNTHLHVDADSTHAILMKQQERPGGDPSQISCENVRVTGSAAGTVAIEVIDRNNCVFDDVCIQQTGTSRDGLRLISSEDNVLRNSVVDVTGRPLILHESSIERTNVTLAGEGRSADCDAATGNQTSSTASPMPTPQSTAADDGGDDPSLFGFLDAFDR